MRPSTGHVSLMRPRLGAALALLAVATGALAFAALPGCSKGKSEPRPVKTLPPKYTALPPRESLPHFMKGTIHEFADIENDKPFTVSSFGLVVGLADTGDNSGTPLAVRNYIRDEMVKHGFGSQDDQLKPYVPERVLEDKRTAVVEVYGLLPVGARAGQRMDVIVRAVEGSATRSLSRGILYQCDLRINGADRLNPRGSVNIFAKAKGPVFVSPVHLTGNPTTQPGLGAILRRGEIMNGGIVMMDRPVKLRVRQPQLSVSRQMELRIDQRFEDLETSRTQDEGYVNVLVPTSFNGDWERFMGVVTHLYMNGTPGFGAVKARELAAEALKPDAPLKDISFCWEGIGAEAVPFIQPLYGHASADIAFAAARAGAFIRDAAAEEALLTMATNDAHPFQFNAVKALSGLPHSRRQERMLTQVLASRNSLARIAAYHTLAENDANVVASTPVRDLFLLDLVAAKGPPMVYATRTGVPRIAIFGPGLSLNTPIVFSTLDSRLTITTPPDGRGVTVFDRTSSKLGGAHARMSSELYELIRRLGGGARDQGDEFAMSYSDLVAILKSLSDGKYITASFVLQDSPSLQNEIEDAPPLPSEVEATGQPPARDLESQIKQLSQR